jgi:hypothetical protein
MADLRAVQLTSGERRWRARYRDTMGRQVVKQFKRKSDATAWINQATHDRIAGTLAHAKAGRQTLQALYDEVHEVRRYAPATASMHAVAWKHVRSAVRSAPNSSIDAATVERVLSKVEAPAMREKLRAILSTLFTHAIASRRISRSVSSCRLALTRGKRPSGPSRGST